jgi:hypothetical protein
MNSECENSMKNWMIKMSNIFSLYKSNKVENCIIWPCKGSQRLATCLNLPGIHKHLQVFKLSGTVPELGHSQNKGPATRHRAWPYIYIYTMIIYLWKVPQVAVKKWADGWELEHTKVVVYGTQLLCFWFLYLDEGMRHSAILGSCAQFCPHVRLWWAFCSKALFLLWMSQNACEVQNLQ